MRGGVQTASEQQLMVQSGVSANLRHGAENWPCRRCLRTTEPEDIPLVTCTPLMLSEVTSTSPTESVLTRFALTTRNAPRLLSNHSKHRKISFS
jgi:hypothetical protein